MPDNKVTVKCGLYRTSKKKGPGTAKLLGTFDVELEYPAIRGMKKAIGFGLETIRARARALCEERGLRLRAVSAIVDPDDIHVAVYVTDRGQGASAIPRKKPVKRGGPQGGPIGSGLKRRTKRTIKKNRAAK